MIVVVVVVLAAVTVRNAAVTVRNEYDKKLIMTESMENRENSTNESIYFIPALPKADVFKENQVMKKRRELQEEGVPLEKLKFCNFKLFNDGKKVEIDGNAPPKKQSSPLGVFLYHPI